MARRRVLSALLVCGVLPACSGTPASPSGTAPQVTAVSPTSGTTFGGTVVTVTGRNFDSMTKVSFGSVAATDVAVTNSGTLTATTPVHAAGTVDVAVSAATGAAHFLKAAFSFVAPAVVPNSPPVVMVTATGSRASEPQSYANIDEPLAVVATAVDAESPASSLAFEWATDAGTITGGGPAVTWTAPHRAGSANVTVKVTETYATPDASGLPVQRTHVVTTSTGIDVHDETTEIGSMARTFLMRFSQSNVPPADVMVDFKDGCGAGGTGKADELRQVTANRQNYRILDYSVGSPRVTVAFNGVSPYRARRGDAFAAVDVRWLSQCLVADAGCGSVGGTREDVGVDWLTSEYDSATRRWWLCDSDYQPAGGLSLSTRYLK